VNGQSFGNSFPKSKAHKNFACDKERISQSRITYTRHHKLVSLPLVEKLEKLEKPGRDKIQDAVQETRSGLFAFWY
jgi:hypothetical protein